MNLVGKILTVLIFVMSLIFMSFAVAVYATHVNWKKVVDNADPLPGENKGLNQRLQDEKARYQELKDKFDRLQADYAAEKDAQVQVRGKLEAENETLKHDMRLLEEEQAKQQEAVREATAAMNAALDTAAKLREETIRRRDEIREAEHQRDAHFDNVQKLTDELHAAVNKRESLKRISDQLAADLAKAKRVLRHHDLTVETNIASTPPQIDGLVTAVQSGGLVEISLGSDDGLMEGHDLNMIRPTPSGSTYVGKIRVIRTAADKSVCKVIPEFLKTQPQRGDRVTTKL